MEFLQTPFYQFAAILALAAVAGAVGLLLRQPLIVMFIAVGIGVGPAGPGGASPGRATGSTCWPGWGSPSSCSSSGCGWTSTSHAVGAVVCRVLPGTLA